MIALRTGLQRRLPKMAAARRSAIAATRWLTLGRGNPPAAAPMSLRTGGVNAILTADPDRNWRELVLESAAAKIWSCSPNTTHHAKCFLTLGQSQRSRDCTPCLLPPSEVTQGSGPNRKILCSLDLDPTGALLNGMESNLVPFSLLQDRLPEISIRHRAIPLSPSLVLPLICPAHGDRFDQRLRVRVNGDTASRVKRFQRGIDGHDLHSATGRRREALGQLLPMLPVDQHDANPACTEIANASAACVCGNLFQRRGSLFHRWLGIHKRTT